MSGTCPWGPRWPVTPCSRTCETLALIPPSRKGPCNCDKGNGEQELNKKAMCRREQKRSYLLIFFISESSGLVCCNPAANNNIYKCFTSTSFNQKGEILAQSPKSCKAWLQEFPLHSCRWHGSIAASLGSRARHGATRLSMVSRSQQGNGNHGMSLMWATDQRLTGDHTWNHQRGVATPDGRPYLKLSERCSGMSSWPEGLVASADTWL